MKLLLACILLSFMTLICGLQAHAFLENLRHGYTSCSTCHYNRQGGGLLMGYGQALGSEIMFGTPSSAQPDENGELSQKKWFRARTDLRGLQIIKDDVEKTKAVFIPMQADAHALILLPRTQVQATYGAKSTNSFGKRKTEWLLRSYHIEFEVADAIQLKGGLFMPPFGLPLIEHNLLIKKELGFDQNQESHNILLSSAHGSMAYDFYRFEKNQEGQTGERGYGGQFRYYLQDKHLISISHHSSDERKKYGIAGFISLPWQQSGLFLEADETFEKKEPQARGRAYFLRYLAEPSQGIKPYAQIEGFNPQIENSENETRAWGLGLQYLPAEHWDLTGQFGQNSFGSGNKETLAFLNVHFYWQTL